MAAFSELLCTSSEFRTRSCGAHWPPHCVLCPISECGLPAHSRLPCQSRCFPDGITLGTCLRFLWLWKLLLPTRSSRGCTALTPGSLHLRSWWLPYSGPLCGALSDLSFPSL